MDDCSAWFGQEITLLKNPKFKDTWDVWEKRKYISGIGGAPCTMELKVIPRLAFQKPDDIHIFGYTADEADVKRAKELTENWPELKCEFPLIERGLTKASCMSMVEKAGLKLPAIYSFGFPNANCVPCCKATSPDYWAMVRENFPKEFDRMVKLSRKLGARLARVDGERVFIDEVPQDQKLTEPLAPDCDFLCVLAEQDLDK